MNVIHTDKAPAAVGPYSQAISSGELVITSGQIPLDPVTGALVEGGIVAQTTQVLENMKQVLAAAGMTFQNVMKTTVFLTDINDFGAMNEVYAEFFTAPYPARAAFQVAALPKAALVEIECVAVK